VDPIHGCLEENITKLPSFDQHGKNPPEAISVIIAFDSCPLGLLFPFPEEFPQFRVKPKRAITPKNRKNKCLIAQSHSLVFRFRLIFTDTIASL